MEDQRPAAATVDEWNEQFSGTLQQHREHAEQLLQGEHDRIARIEAALSEQIESVSQELDHERMDIARRDTEVARQRAELEEKVQTLARQREELERRQHEWEERQSHATARQEKMLGDLHSQLEKLD
ncbi:MAG: hypothetical protein ACODAD_15595, partial [Planctomycetota bacterium]